MVDLFAVSTAHPAIATNGVQSKAGHPGKDKW